MSAKPFNPDLIKPPAPDGPTGEGPLSVSQLTAMVKRALSRLPPHLAVAGEISNFARSPNGHLYFTLKDDQSAVNCVMWRSSSARLKFQPESGLVVIAFGQIDVYEPRGHYQLYVTRLVPQGRGELELAFRQLCEKLDKLGWFDPARKRPVPRIPRTIGVVTSRAGAALRDILRTLAIRWPIARVLVADARVQGEGSGESVAGAVGLFNRHAAALGGVDVLIVARGGGSLEDLWAFNTEVVARAIRDSTIPVVSGVGHEVDVTIADLIADLRTATPTAAAQAVVPDRSEVQAAVNASAGLLSRMVAARMTDLRRRLTAAARFEVFRRPAAMLRAPRQLLDEVAGRLRWAQREANSIAERKLADLAARLGAHRPRPRLATARQSTQRAAAALHNAVGRFLRNQRRLLEERQRQLAAYDPRGVLRRGYSMTTRKDSGRLVTSADQVRPGDRVVTELADGRVESDVVPGYVPAASAPRDAPRRRRPSDPDQLDLGFGSSV